MNKRIAFTSLLVPFLGLESQVVRGRVTLSASDVSVAGVVLVATDGNGKTAARALSDTSGSYSIRLPAAGRYVVRATRIGFQPVVLPSFDVSANEVVVRDAAITPIPITLGAVTVREQDDCGMKGAEADLFVHLWDQARAALATTSMVQSGGDVDVHVVRLDGLITETERGFRSIPSMPVRVSSVESSRLHRPRRSPLPGTCVGEVTARSYMTCRASTRCLPMSL